ncbi:hypothetical protein L345_00861, partial [Ophiophagus hannah]
EEEAPQQPPPLGGESQDHLFFLPPPNRCRRPSPSPWGPGSRRAGKGGAGAGRKGEKGERPRENSNGEKTICGGGSEGRRLCLRHVVGVAACLLCFCLLYSIACLAFPLPLLGPSVAVFVSATGCLYLARARSGQKTTSVTLISSPPP